MPRTFLQNQLDREVLQIVTRYRDAQSESELKTHLLYRYIQTSNSSLKRRPRKQLEDSIERAVAIIRQEEKSEEEESSSPETLSSRRRESPSRLASPDFMNKLIVGDWNMNGNGAKASKSELRVEKDAPQRKRKRTEEKTPKATDVEAYSLADLGGIDDIMVKLGDFLIGPLLNPDIYIANNLEMPRGILLHGPPGCGKTTLARAFASLLDVPFVEILGPSVVSGMSGESEQNIRERFDEAKKLAPSIIFIDEIDVLAPKRDQSGSQMEKRIVAQLLISMDELAHHKNGGKTVVVIGATNRPDVLDPALRRAGRFNSEVNMGVPNEKMRESILRVKLRKTPHSDDVDFQALAKATAGYVGADLTDLVSQAGNWALDRYKKACLAYAASTSTQGPEIQSENAQDESQVQKDLRSLVAFFRGPNRVPPGYDVSVPLLSMAAFNAAFKVVQPSALREGFTTVPQTTWADVGALEDVRQRLISYIVDPIRQPEYFAKLNLNRPGGVLLWGPPGCGKTLLAKAVANESKANFISVQGPELLSKYLGESEKAVRTVFMRARSSVPCVLFFDELDALAPRRDGDGAEGTAARVVGALLAELDGLKHSREGIYVIGATNRKDMIDAAILRPGRFSNQVFVGLPSPAGRVSILRTLLKSTSTEDQELEAYAEMAAGQEWEGFSGADLELVVQTAGQKCYKRNGDVLGMRDFEEAVKEVKPSVRDYKRFLRMAGVE
jgi:ribosome biogenesis ATPase